MNFGEDVEITTNAFSQENKKKPSMKKKLTGVVRSVAISVELILNIMDNRLELLITFN